MQGTPHVHTMLMWWAGPPKRSYRNFVLHMYVGTIMSQQLNEYKRYFVHSSCHGHQQKILKKDQFCSFLMSWTSTKDIWKKITSTIKWACHHINKRLKKSGFESQWTPNANHEHISHLTISIKNNKQRTSRSKKRLKGERQWYRDCY
jgi:hypothetical protein